MNRYNIRFTTAGGEIVSGEILAEDEDAARYNAYDEFSHGSSGDIHQIIDVEFMGIVEKSLKPTKP